MISKEISFRLRPLTFADQAAAGQLILGGLGEHFPTLKPELNPDLDDLYTTYIARGHHFIVAEIQGEIVGTGGLSFSGEQAGRILRVSVKGDLRGLGIGRAIVEHLIELARQAQLRRLVVETNHDWQPAVALYQGCGFTEYDRDEESIHLEYWL